MSLTYQGNLVYRSSVFFSSLTIKKTFSRKLLIFPPLPCTVPEGDGLHYEEHSFRSPLWHRHCHHIPLPSFQKGKRCLSPELQLWPGVSYTRNSENVTPEPTASASPGKLLEMHVLRSYLRHPTEGTLRVGMRVCVFAGSPGDSLRATVLVLWTTLPYSYTRVVEEHSACFQKVT